MGTESEVQGTRGHQDRGRHSLAGNVSEEKVQIRSSAPRPDQVDMIAADDAERLVVVVDLPTPEREVAGREQSGLDLCRHVEIVLQGVALLLCQALQTDLLERSATQQLLIELAVTFLALLGKRKTHWKAFFSRAICPAW